MSWFCSLRFGYHPPAFQLAAGCLLWWEVRADRHLHIRQEWLFQHLDESDLARQALTKTAALGIPRIGYTVADPILFPAKMAGPRGQYIAESLSYYGWPVVPADAETFNGWKRVQSLLRLAPNGRPWLTIDPSCTTLIQDLTAGMSDDQRPDEMSAEAPALIALRYGAMSRPAPDRPVAKPVCPAGTPGYIMLRELHAHRQHRWGWHG